MVETKKLSTKEKILIHYILTSTIAAQWDGVLGGHDIADQTDHKQYLLDMANTKKIVEKFRKDIMGDSPTPPINRE